MLYFFVSPSQPKLTQFNAKRWRGFFCFVYRSSSSSGSSITSRRFFQFYSARYNNCRMNGKTRKLFKESKKEKKNVSFKK